MIRSLSRILSQAAAPFNKQISYATTLYCPRCDKPIAPGHRCLSRRHFFGMLGAAAATILVPPAVSLPVPLTHLQAGDHLSLSMDHGSLIWSISLMDSTGAARTLTGPVQPNAEPMFIAPSSCVITSVSVLSGSRSVRLVQPLPHSVIQIRRGRQA